MVRVKDATASNTGPRTCPTAYRWVANTNGLAVPRKEPAKFRGSLQKWLYKIPNIHKSRLQTVAQILRVGYRLVLRSLEESVLHVRGTFLSSELQQVRKKTVQRAVILYGKANWVGECISKRATWKCLCRKLLEDMSVRT